MGLTNAERQRRWRKRHPAESLRHLHELRDEQERIRCKNIWRSDPPPLAEVEIERILRKRRTSDGNTETLVSFRGWANSFNRWLTDSELQQYHAKRSSAPK